MSLKPGHRAIKLGVAARGPRSAFARPLSGPGRDAQYYAYADINDEDDQGIRHFLGLCQNLTLGNGHGPIIMLRSHHRIGVHPPLRRIGQQHEALRGPLRRIDRVGALDPVPVSDAS
jgi:hypothetical protein